MADAIDAAVQAFVSFFSSEAGEALVEEAVKVVVAAGVDAAVQAVQGKPKVGATATQLQTKVGATTPRAIIMGRAPIAGTVLTPTPLKSGKDDRFASNFYALSHAGPSGVVESVIWGDDTVTFDANGNAIGKYNDNMWLFQKNGDWNQTAISYSGHAVLGSSTPSAWDSTKRARGCLTVALVVRYAAKVLGGNMQTPLFVVDANAAVLIDPRTGSPATTQAQRRNPAVWAYSWRLGWFQNSKRVIGMGQASGELHAAGYAYAANVADANGWVISGEATTADDRYAVETAILQACASTPVERNGLQSVVTSALRSSVGTITSNDLRADPKWRYNTQQSSRPTAIQTRYRSESNRWQMVEGAEVTDASWLTQDAGREKRVMVEYAYAGGGSAHVGHLAALEASNAREPLVFNLPCKQQARYAGFVGDAVTVSLPEIGLSSTKMTVQGRIVNSDGTVDYELLVETDAKYDFAAGKTSAAPSFTLQPGFDIFSVPQPGSSEWAAVAAQITSGATSLPIVRVTGSAADYSFASGVVFKIRLNSDGSPWLVSEDAPPAVTQHEFRGLTNATSYIVGVAYRGVTGVEGPVRELAAVTTGVMVSASTGAVEPGAVRVGTDIFPGSGSTPLPGTQLLNSEIGIDGNGRLTNTGTGSAIVGNAQITIDGNGRLTTTGTGSAIVDNGRITIDALGRLTTTGTGSVVVDNSKITLGTLGFTGATDATRNVVSTGLLSARPTGVDGDIFFATDDNNGAGLVYTKIAGAWVADPKAKVLFDNLTTTVNNNEATNSLFRSSQTATNSATSTSLSTLSAKFTADQQADYLSNGQFLRGTSDWVATAGLSIGYQSPEGVSGRYGVFLNGTFANGAQSFSTTFGWPTWKAVDLAWVGIVTLWGGGNINGTVRAFIQGKVGAGAWTTIANTSFLTGVDVVSTPRTLRATAAAGYDTIRLLFELDPASGADTVWILTTQRVSNWTGEFPSLDAGPRTLVGTEARIGVEESTRASADSALATRATTLEATVNNGTTGVAATAARLTTEESARASADSALASRNTTLEARVNVSDTAINPNANFEDYPNSTGLPAQWSDWSFGGTAERVAGLNGHPWRMRLPAAANAQVGLYRDMEALPRGWYVLEVEGALLSGTWQGAGVFFFRVPAFSDVASLNCATEPDIHDRTGASVGGLRMWRKLVYLSLDSETPRLYVASHWDGLGSIASANSIVWSRAAIRPASDSEIELRAARNGAASVGARITTEESARASGDSANASLITTLTARSYVKGNLIKGSRPNYDASNPNNLFSRFGWLFQGLWNVANSPYVDGPYLSQGLTSQTNYTWGGLATNAMPVVAGVPVSIQAILGKFGTWNTGTLQLQIYWYSDTAGNTLHSGGPSKNWESGMVIAGQVQGAAARWVDIANAVVPSGVQSFRLGINTINATGNGVYTEGAAWMLKAEYGSTCTAWTDEAMPLEIDARVTSVNSVAVDGRGRAYAISGTQTEVNGRKGGFVMDNDGVVTNFQITADDFRIYQSVGSGFIVPFRVVGGQTQIDDALIRNLNVIPDGGGPSHRVQLRPNSVSGADGASFTFSTAYGGIPLVRAVITSPPALAAGETYEVVPVSLSTSGFTVRAKKFTPGTPTAQSSGAGSNVGGTPTWQVDKPTSADGDGGQYTFTYTARLARISNEYTGSNYYAEYEGYYDVYYNAGSGWVFAYTDTYFFAGFYSSSPSTVDVSASTTASLPAIGQHGGAEFGLHPTLGSITAFAGVSYTTTTQSSVVALPGNFTFDIYPPT